MTFTPEQLRAQLAPIPASSRLWVAYSGGLDSTVLLHSLVQLHLPQRLAALHINHQLSQNALAWVEHCAAECEALGVPLSVEKVTVQPAGRGVEDAAREARYAVFQRYLEPGDYLLTGHHADDQAETLLFRLMRGTGPRGLAAIAPQRPMGAGVVLRPLLSVPQNELEAYARAQGLSWVTDDSNVHVSFDRNYLRHRVLPLLAERWPGYTAQWQKTAELCAENEILLEELALLDLDAAQCRQEPAGWSLSLEAMQALSPPRRANVLRFWLRRMGVPVPGREALQQIDAQLLQGRNNPRAQYRWGDWVLRTYQQRLYLLAHALLPPDRVQDLPQISFALTPEADQRVMLPVAGGLHLEWHGSTQPGLLRADLTQLTQLQVRWRQGGERCRPHDRAHSQSLKKLLQAAGLPPWWRPYVPLLYSGEQLVAVGDLWVCHGFTAPVGESGYRIHWQRDEQRPVE